MLLRRDSCRRLGSQKLPRPTTPASLCYTDSLNLVMGTGSGTNAASYGPQTRLSLDVIEHSTPGEQWLMADRRQLFLAGISDSFSPPWSDRWFYGEGAVPGLHNLSVKRDVSL